MYDREYVERVVASLATMNEADVSVCRTVRGCGIFWRCNVDVVVGLVGFE